ncbi:RagB/SusD family nutrient uptake outer membrane protein [Flavobacterium hydrophilum]|uniref:RagB/SusD family nutrient uptake outer membrane protein n=1 Tax=Flavobacterium hydrophilum TaxID=2211445 RepID=A0A2V4BZ50_9FLAO|nr:RagB/SusD family nutrient uptake outer membrane protein [Flavobacterium hydrophilum]PXY43902.1 RagB/SusD family nutrient uptake outer membrane protein [Flavobacterium hydrophilum]
MKTRFNKYIVVSLLLVLGVSSSCSDDFLEEKKQFKYYDETFLESETRVNQYVNNLYYDFYDGYKTPTAIRVASWTTTETSYTEEVGGISNLINPGITLQNAEDGSSYYGTKLGTTLSNNPYTRIKDCNFLLEKLDVVGAALPKTFRDQIKGQVYFLRGLQYFDLMRMYGGVPIITTVQEASPTDESIKIPRATVAEVVNQIVADLDQAATLLPPNWDASNYGRFTKGAALAQKSRVLLTYASPLFNKNWDSATDRWDKALAAGLAAETQLTADGYGLYGSNAKQWAEMFYIIDNAKNPEAITVKLLANGTTALFSNNSWERSIRLASQGGVAGSGVKVPKRMIDLFPTNTGARPVAGTNYDPFIFFKNRDPRFYRTFGFSGCAWPYNNATGATLQTTVWAYRWAVNNTPTTAFGFSMGNDVPSPAFVRKMSNPTVANTSNFQYSGTDIIEYRYAELLLNIAECYAAKGDISNTLAYLGKIRQRVGIPSGSNYGIGTLADKYAAIEAVLYERRVELAYEGKRFWDIQRWMLYSDDSSVNQDNTNVKLGIPDINGTQRIGNYLQYKNGFSPANTDPLAAARTSANISVDPDNANFNAQILALEAFYNANFELKSPPNPMDHVSGTATNILFRPNYYIMGLTQTILAQNPWLVQNKGWNGASGEQGTYIYQE